MNFRSLFALIVSCSLVACASPSSPPDNVATAVKADEDFPLVGALDAGQTVEVDYQPKPLYWGYEVTSAEDAPLSAVFESYDVVARAWLVDRELGVTAEGTTDPADHGHPEKVFLDGLLRAGVRSLVVFCAEDYEGPAAGFMTLTRK